MTIAKAYFDFLEKIKTIYEDREAENISDWVFENTTGLKRWQRRENKNEELNEDAFKKIETDLKELLQHRPVQYVLNEAWFYKMKFYVNENVLIPRPETEELVEWIITDLKKEKYSKPTNIIDIGTGSGCIPIALKKVFPNTSITAIDISEKALHVAKKNAKNLQTEIHFLQNDFLNENRGKSLPAYDIIVSNPPYIPFSEKEILSKNVTDFEPGIALFVENNDPYIFYKRIAEFAKSHLNENGKIYVEVHEEYAKDVNDIFKNTGFISQIKNDIYGKERMVKGWKIQSENKAINQLTN
ncbi:MAG TPA: peptide chain release factor N(5)-glutamine methyltransferase [Hanamia sp.]|nr:peptide chain release factor N(5)-glutamine methyltransferase [Hanamia sp.]